MNLQFSCSFFLQGEGTPNGRLRERAGRLDVLDVAWGSVGQCDVWELRPPMEFAGGLLPGEW